MFFNSLQYLFFLSFLFVLYWHVASVKVKYQNILLLVASIFFYALFDVRLCLILLFISLSDFLNARWVESQVRKAKKNYFLLLSILIDIGILLVFRGFDFFIAQFEKFLTFFGFQTNSETLNLIVPVGLSFYALKSLGYVIDVYKNRIMAEKCWINYFLYVSFFPQLVSGPIDRARNLLPQISVKRTFQDKLVVSGFRLILLGLFKKMVIADHLAPLVSAVFNKSQNFTSSEVATAMIFFGIQLYADFSGYTDIAVGSARLFGFYSMKNFRKPYFSLSVSEFWSRWHISLSTWFRDYVFLPLAFVFSRKMVRSRYAGIKTEYLIYSFAVLPTFFLTGLWHGAGLNFIVWGLVFAVLLIIERFTEKPFRNLRKSLKKMGSKSLFKVFSGSFVFLLISVNWIFFRAPATDKAIQMLDALFSNLTIEMPQIISGILSNKSLWIGFPIFLIIEIFPGSHDFDEFIGSFSTSVRWTLYWILLAVILIFGSIDLEQGYYYSIF